MVEVVVGVVAGVVDMAMYFMVWQSGRQPDWVWWAEKARPIVFWNLWNNKM